MILKMIDVVPRCLRDMGCCSAWGELIHRLLPWLRQCHCDILPRTPRTAPSSGHEDRGASLLLALRGVLLHPLCQHLTFHRRPEFTARETFPEKNMHQGYSDGFQKRIFLSFLVIIILQLNLRTHKSKDMNAHDPMCFCMASSLLTQPGYRPPSICVQIAFLDLHAIANQSNEQLSSPKVPQSE